MRKIITVILVFSMILLMDISVANAVETASKSNVSIYSSDCFDKDKVNAALKGVILKPNAGPKAITFNDGSSMVLTYTRTIDNNNFESQIDTIQDAQLATLIYNGALSIEYNSESGVGPIVLIYTIHATWNGHETMNRATLISHYDSFERNLLFATLKGTRGIITDGTYIIVRGGWQTSVPGAISHTYDFYGYPDGSASITMIS